MTNALRRQAVQLYVRLTNETENRKLALLEVRREFKKKLRCRHWPVSRAGIYRWAQKFNISLP